MNPHWNSYLNRTLSRREMLRVSSTGFGALALAGLLGEAAAGGRDQWRRRARSAGGQGAALRAARQAGDLPVHARRPFAGGHVRLQAAAAARSRQAAALPASQSGVERDLQPAEIAVGVQTVRAERHVGERPVPGVRQARGRRLLHQVDVGLELAARRGAARTAHRQRHVRAARRWAPGSPTGWAAKTRACRASSRSARRRATAAPTTTRRRFCRRRTRARRSARSGSRRSDARIPYIANTETPQRHPADGAGLRAAHQPRATGIAPDPTRRWKGASKSFELAFRMQIGGAGTAGHLRRIGGHAQALRAGRPRDRGLRPAVPDGAAPQREAECGSCR